MANNVHEYYPLFEHMSREHGLTLLDSDMEEIVQVVDKMRLGRENAVPAILVNALRHLDNAQMKALHEEIGRRIAP